MNYAVEQRLRLIDFLLFHYGSVGREQLIDYFGIGEACGTRDLKKYREAYPENIALNASTKRYVKSETFKRVW